MPQTSPTSTPTSKAPQQSPDDRAPRPSSKRDQLVEAAARLFQRNGYHATGIEAIIAEAGVAKMTLYKHFQSKDDLIVAVLERRAEDALSQFAADLEKAADTPRGRLLRIFPNAEARCVGSGFTGCLFQKASGEFSDPDCRVHDTARAFGQRFTAYIAGLARDAGAPEPDELAAELWVLYSGCVTLSQMQSSGEPIRVAARVAQRLIDDAIPA